MTIRRVLVTGAASGIGRGTAALLAARGLAIVGLDRDAAGVAAAMDELRASGADAYAVSADVADPRAVIDAVDEAARVLGGLDGVVNAAGIGGYTGDVVATSPEAWNTVITVDLGGIFYVSRAAVPHLRAAGAGVIVNVSSQFGVVGCLASPAYCAAKAGVIGLTRAMALDHASEGIRVTCISPGPVDTPLRDASLAQPEFDRVERERSARRLPLGRPARVEEVAGAIAFLLSDDATYMTGASLALDGGWTAA